MVQKHNLALLKNRNVVNNHSMYHSPLVVPLAEITSKVTEYDTSLLKISTVWTAPSSSLTEYGNWIKFTVAATWIKMALKLT